MEPLFKRSSGVFVRDVRNLKDMEEQFLTFPAGRHDDIIDAFSYVLQLISWREELETEPVRYRHDNFVGVCW